MKERSVNEIFQEIYDKRLKHGLGATGAPLRQIDQGNLEEQAKLFDKVIERLTKGIGVWYDDEIGFKRNSQRG